MAETSQTFAQWTASLESKAGVNGAPGSARSDFSQDDADENLDSRAEQLALGRTAEQNLRELEQEMKLLRWHKLANEAALKAALIKTRRLKGKEAVDRGGLRQTEKAAWMQQVIQEEQGKPLEVTETYIREFKKREKKDDHRIERNMRQHLTNLKRVKAEVERREDIRVRHQVYKEKKKILERRQKAIQDAALARGRARKKIDPSDLLDAPTLVSELSAVAARKKSPSGKTKSKESNGNELWEDFDKEQGDDDDEFGEGKREGGESEGDFGQVVTSLDKLVELEKRISLLEKGYDAMPLKKTSVMFSKQRDPAQDDKPALTKYHVRVKPPRARREPPGHSNQAGTFLTSLPTVDSNTHNNNNNNNNKTEGVRKVKRRGKTSPSSSSSSMSRVRSRMEGAQRQEAAVSKWLKERNNTSKRARPKANGQSTAVGLRSSGNSVGARAKERMKEFKDVRKQYDRKKQQMTRNLHARNDGSTRTRVSRTSNKSQTTSKGKPKMIGRNGPGLTGRGKAPSVMPQMGTSSFGGVQGQKL